MKMNHIDYLKAKDVIYEDNHIIAINKPAGILVQGDKTGDKSLLDLTKFYLKKKYNKPGDAFIGLPHRIDRPASGIVLLSKTSKSLSRLSLLFKEKNIQKKYWVIVKKEINKKSGTLIHYLKKNKNKNKSFVSNEEKAGYLKSELKYQLLKKLNKFLLYEIQLITGRHHQIRAQLSHIGSPIKGDIKYGSKRTNNDGSICLHAKEITFTHPVKKEKIIINAPLPKNGIWNYC